jgi:uncharacterized membrane protein
MHLIPESWAHFHMLVSVFPSVGLLIVMGVYVSALSMNNEGAKRVSLALLAVLGVLAIPTYFSGTGSAADVANNPRFSPGAIAVHLNLSYLALATLIVTGAVAAYELWQYRSTGYLTKMGRNIVLAAGGVTVLLMAIVGELGWEINHNELVLDPAKQMTSQYWSHVHIILNHFPTIGVTLTLAVFLAGFAMKNDGLKKVSLALFAIFGILGAPTYVTGAAAMWALKDVPGGISQAAINAHRDFALFSLFGLAATGVTAYLELWRYRYLQRFSNTMLYLVLTFAVITLGLMAETGHRGGQINHPEIRVDPLPVDANAYLSPHIETLINNVIWFVPWQTVHFFGYSLVFGTVLAVVLRIFGMWKSVPFSAVHRLLPLGVFGVAMNVFTGMLMLMADTFRYVNEITFVPKMFFLPIGAIAVLYFSLSDRLFRVKAGESAPATAKWVAALLLISWVAVIMGGRLLPYV